MSLRLLVFGRTGQVATELRRLAGPGLEVRALGRAEADLADPQACAAALRAAADGGAADAVINAAAYTAVDKAETEEALATRVNGEAPGAMARAAAERNIPFLHISTDYVFDGAKDGPWAEDDPPAPLGAYGRSKLAGERAIAEAGGPHVILRTAWVHAGHGQNFVRTMLRAGASRAGAGGRLTVVDDQWGGPTPAPAIAAALVSMAGKLAAGRGATGIFHLCGTPATSWCGFARAIFAATGWPRIPQVTAISSEQWPTPARRPKNSVLDCHKIAESYAIPQPRWQGFLPEIVGEALSHG